MLPLGKFASPAAVTWIASLPGWTNDAGKETLRRKPEANAPRNVPVFIRSQNESVPPLVPRLSGVKVKDLAVQLGLSVHIYHEEALALSCSQLLVR